MTVYILEVDHFTDRRSDDSVSSDDADDSKLLKAW